MNMRKKLITLISLALIVIMIIPFTAFAEDDEEDGRFTRMTPEELSGYLLEIGAGFNPMEITGITGTGVVAKMLNVSPSYSLGKLAVTYYTKASSIANRVGIKDLKLYEGSSLSSWTEIRDSTDFDLFKQEYSSGYFYNSPVSGYYYFAEGDHYCVFGTTLYESHKTSSVVQY